MPIVPLDQGRRPPVAGRQLDLASVEIDVGLEVGQPVREGQRGIAQRIRQSLAEIGGIGVGSQLEHQVTDGGTREPGVEEPEQEHDGRDPDHGERRALDRQEPGHGEGSCNEQDGDHHQPEGEEVDEQGQRPTARPAGLPTATDEEPHADQANRAQRE